MSPAFLDARTLVYLSTEKHWSTQEYSAFYVCWGIVGFFGLWLTGWLADRIGRRVGFIAMLIQGAIFMTLWVYTDSHILLWVFGLAWSFGFLGFWGPSTTLTAEVFSRWSMLFIAIRSHFGLLQRIGYAVDMRLPEPPCICRH